MSISESSQSKLEQFTFDMKMRAVYLRVKKQEALFRNLPNGIERSEDFIFKLFDEYQIDHEKGIAALMKFTEKELEFTEEELWQTNLRLIPLQILLFFMKPFS